MITVIAEKPSVAQHLARHLNANARHDGYYEGNGYQVTWAYGHLVRLASPKDYQWQPSLESLPFCPKPFILKGPSQASSKKQLNVIKQLFNSSKEIVVATDAGREGELIFRYIYSYLNCDLPFRRLWISSLTPEAIAKGWQDLKDGKTFDPLYDSARARSEADWLIGMNASIALTKSANAISVLSLGRVQTPVLSMICARYLAQEDFQSIAFFTPQIDIAIDDCQLRLKYNGDMLFQDSQAKSLIESLGDNLTCTEYQSKPVNSKQPLLFDLTSLQRVANKRHSLTAKETLSHLQQLYEKKMVTYPRTDSKYISEDIFKDIPDLITTLGQLSFFANTVLVHQLDSLPTTSVNDAKVSDHHAVIPTGQLPSQLDKPLSVIEEQLYELIVRRTFAAFGPICKKVKAKAVFSNDFVFSATLITEPGWMNYETVNNEDQDSEPEVMTLPNFQAHTDYPIVRREVTKGQTQPKPLYTDDTLLNAMETCGKDLDDENLKQALKGKGIGTPATRADIIEVLIVRDYVYREKKKITPTQLGIDIHQAIRLLPISSPELTGEWESKLTDIANGNLSYDSFLQSIEAYCKELIPQIAMAGPSIKTGSGLELTCPKCSDSLLQESKFTFSCEGSGCGFKLNKVIASKKLTDSHITELIRTKKTPLIKGFKKRDNTGSFNAHLVINEEGEVKFKFPDFNKTSGHECPSCQKKTIVINDFGAFCDNCKLKIFRKVSGKKLTESHLIQLLTKGETSKIKGFKYANRQGTFDAIIKLVDGKTQFG